MAVRILPQPVRTGKNTVALADRERHASTHFPTHPRDFLPRGWFFPALTAGVFSSGDGMTGIVFSRSGSTHPLGKLDDEFRIDCHSAVRNILRGMALMPQCLRANSSVTSFTHTHLAVLMNTSLQCRHAWTQCSDRRGLHRLERRTE